jgi:hypothetical protein
LGDIAFAKTALSDWPAVRDCKVIGMRAGDSSGVASKPCEVTGAGEVPVVAEVGPEVGAGEVLVAGGGEVLVAGGGEVLVAGAVVAGAFATGTMTARPARTVPEAARRAREIECAPTEARYAGA